MPNQVLMALVLGVATTSAALGGFRWEALCEPGGGGAIVSLQVSPHNPKHLVASGDMLGAAVSMDGGDSWQPCFGFPAYEMCDSTFHPTDPKVVWMGTCMGPFKSMDGGRNWVSKRAGMPGVKAGGYSVIVEKILFDPDQPRRLLAFGGSSRHWSESDTFGWIWESLDDGETWSHIATLASDGCSTVAKKGVNIWRAMYEPGSGSRLDVLADDLGWWTSADDGRTWTKRAYAGVPGPITGLTFHPRDARTVWASTRNFKANKTDAQCTRGGVFKSEDGGATFAPCDAGIPKTATGDGNLTSWFQDVAVSAANPDVLYVNDQAWNAAVIYRSVDGGANWQPVASRRGIGVDQAVTGKGTFQVETATFAGVALRLVADPASADRVYGYNTEFILRTTDGGRTWDDATAYRPDAAKKDRWRGRGWTGWCSMNFAWNPYRKGQAVAQGMDACRGWISDDGLQSWRYAMGQTIPWLGGQDVGFSRDGCIYITTGQFGDGNGIQRSTDWGQTWTTLVGAERGLPAAGWGNKQEYGGVYVHPEDGKRVWAALKGKLIHSADGGETWTPVAGVVGANYLAGDPTRAGRFYIKTGDGILMTDNGITFTNTGLPRVSGRSRINCDAQGRVLVCQWREGRGGVWRYTPATKAWRRLLDEEQAFECNADPGDATRLLLVTSMDPFYEQAGGNGVWISVDDGASWSAANDNLPMLRANACAFNPFDPAEIVVGTYGMGFFKARWPKDVKPTGTRTYVHGMQDDAAAAPLLPASLPSELLANGNMTTGGAKPDGWSGTWGDVGSARDTEVFRSAPAALRVEGQSGKTGQVFQQIAGHAGVRLRLSGWVRTAGGAKVNVAVQAFDADWQQNAFDQVRYVQGATDWQAFEKVVTIPEWAACFNVLVLVEGAGKAWLDDVRLAPADQHADGQKPSAASPVVSPPATAEAARVVVRNGGMVQGVNAVADWNGGVRDTEISKEGPASLRVDGKGTAAQRIDGLAGQSIRLTGWTRTAGGAKAQVAVQSFAEGYQQNKWQQLVYLQGDSDWTRFEKAITLPAWTKWSEIKLVAEGNGQAWLDEVRDAAGEVDVGRPVTADAEMRRTAPPKGRPDMPAWCIYDWRPAWFDTHDGFVARTRQGGIDVVAYGDSITLGWGNGVDRLVKAANPALTAVNYGIGGDSTRQLLWRIGQGEVDGLSLRLIILAIGTNNLYGDQNAGSDEEIAAGVAAVVKLLRERLPGAKILLLSILPRENEYFCGRIHKINARLAKLAEDGKVIYHDRTALFLDASGGIRKDLFNTDLLHLAAPGYAVWDADLKPLLDAWLN